MFGPVWLGGRTDADGDAGPVSPTDLAFSFAPLAHVRRRVFDRLGPEQSLDAAFELLVAYLARRVPVSERL